MIHVKTIIQVDPPRVRTVWLDRKPVRLAFPALVFIEQMVWGNRNPNPKDQRTVIQAVHYVYAIKENPTWTSPLFMFPLTAFSGAENAYLYNQLVRADSHIDSFGRVCYGRGALPSYYEGQETLLDGFWNSNFRIYNGDFVAKWREASLSADKDFCNTKIFRHVSLRHSLASFSHEFNDDLVSPLDRVGVVSSAAWTGRKELPPRKAPVFPYGRTVVLDTDKE